MLRSFTVCIISKAVLKEDPTRNSTISWTLSSHWGDWQRITGRITSEYEKIASKRDKEIIDQRNQAENPENN